MARVHPTAVIDPAAELDEDVSIGPYSIITGDVTIGRGTEIGPFTRLEGPLTIGQRNRLFGQSSIGTEPQDLKFKGERTELAIGDDNVLREFVTINRGTPGGGGLTRIGSNNFLMAYSHIAHDCHVGSHVIFANNGTLAGHVEIGDFVTVGAFSAVHQFCRVGVHAFIGAATIVTRDVLPFVKTVGGRDARTYGVNALGLERKGFSRESIEALQSAYRILIRSKLRVEEALERIDEELGERDEIALLSEFIRSSARGFIR